MEIVVKFSPPPHPLALFVNLLVKKTYMSNKLKKGLDFLGPDIIIFKKLSEARNEKELKIKKNKKSKSQWGSSSEKG